MFIYTTQLAYGFYTLSPTIRAEGFGASFVKVNIRLVFYFSIHALLRIVEAAMKIESFAMIGENLVNTLIDGGE